MNAILLITIIVTLYSCARSIIFIIGSHIEILFLITDAVVERSSDSLRETDPLIIDPLTSARYVSCSLSTTEALPVE